MAKFIKFKQTVQLNKVSNTLSFTCLFFSKATLILRKSTFKRLRELKLPYDDCFEIDNHLIFYSLQKASITRLAPAQTSTFSYNLPPEHHLVSLRGCPKKKFLVGVTQHEKLETTSVVFWVWDNKNFVYIFEQNLAIEHLKILSPSLLVVFGSCTLKTFDSEKVRFVRTIQSEGEVADVFGFQENQILLRLENGAFFKMDLLSQKTQKVKARGEEGRFVFMEKIKSLLDVSNLKSIEFVLF